MKPKNFPDRVTRRRARAFERKHGRLPASYDAARREVTDIRFRRAHGKGILAQKFEGKIA
jgi:hypothetical protein